MCTPDPDTFRWGRCPSAYAHIDFARAARHVRYSAASWSRGCRRVLVSFKQLEFCTLMQMLEHAQAYVQTSCVNLEPEINPKHAGLSAVGPLSPSEIDR